MAHVVRLYIDHPLGAGESVPLDAAAAHRLGAVMRLSVGAQILLFNGHDGEWSAQIAQLGKKQGLALVQAQSGPQVFPPDLWLLFAPIKKARTDFIVEKATEMGASRICPVQTDYTNSDRIRQDKLQAHAVEAAEQCGGTFVPTIDPIMRLTQILRDWPRDRSLVFCDEGLVGDAATFDVPPGPSAIVIGPEGGFSPVERRVLQDHAQSYPISLGPRILRADTAAVAALTLWQIHNGDWT